MIISKPWNTITYIITYYHLYFFCIVFLNLWSKVVSFFNNSIMLHFISVILREAFYFWNAYYECYSMYTLIYFRLTLTRLNHSWYIFSYACLLIQIYIRQRSLCILRNMNVFFSKYLNVQIVTNPYFEKICFSPQYFFKNMYFYSLYYIDMFLFYK